MDTPERSNITGEGAGPAGGLSAPAGGGGEPSSSPSAAVVATAPPSSAAAAASSSSSGSSRYESQKRRDWNTFLQYLKNHKPPLTLARCSGAHVIEFLKYLDQFGKTKVHITGCSYFGNPNPPAPCACPLRQAWGSLDALIGRLRAAYEESGGRPESNPFGAKAVRIYLREVREGQAKARGIPYEKKKKKRKRPGSPPKAATAGGGGGGISIGGDPDAPPQTASAHHEAALDGGGSGGDGCVGPASTSTASAPAVTTISFPTSNV